jgi:hypothetical protein
MGKVIDITHELQLRAIEHGLDELERVIDAARPSVQERCSALMYELRRIERNASRQDD